MAQWRSQDLILDTHSADQKIIFHATALLLVAGRDLGLYQSKYMLILGRILSADDWKHYGRRKIDRSGRWWFRAWPQPRIVESSTQNSSKHSKAPNAQVGYRQGKQLRKLTEGSTRAVSLLDHRLTDVTVMSSGAIEVLLH